MVQLHRGIRGRFNQGGIPFGKLSNASFNGKSGLWVGGRTWWSGSARTPQPLVVVTDGRGNYYFARKRATSVAFTDVVVCGCAKRKCGPYGSGCPACGATMQQVYGPFKPSDQFHGFIDIKFKSFAVSIRHAQGQCRPMRRCPAPPPSMPRR